MKACWLILRAVSLYAVGAWLGSLGGVMLVLETNIVAWLLDLAQQHDVIMTGDKVGWALVGLGAIFGIGAASSAVAGAALR